MSLTSDDDHCAQEGMIAHDLTISLKSPETGVKSADPWVEDLGMWAKEGCSNGVPIEWFMSRLAR